MIRLAFLGVALLAGLLAFGAFFLARGSEGGAVDVKQAAPAPQTPEAAPEPTIEKLYFLRDIDLGAGDIALVLYQSGANGKALIIRDAAALAAAKDTAHVTAAGFAIAPNRAPTPETYAETYAEIYRDDVLVASVQCSSPCGPTSNTDDAGLTALGMPLVRIDDQFDSYGDYLTTIDAVATDPNYMLLNARPDGTFPQPQRPATLTVRLPTVISATDDAFNLETHTAKVRDALTPLLPDGARLDRVQIENQGFAVLGDKDNNSPVVLNDAEIPFLEARFFSVLAHVTGTTTLPASAYDTLSNATLDQHNTETDFAAFVTGALDTTCVDCYFLKIEGDFTDTAYAQDWRAESYSLSYYDLREAP
ncbi:hypothetical protein L0664_03495 [Octadecabacter sp. G9-8]|uniref:Uncharacterized protein n=1 Tax=Octadecabacter dasysiphoniae TaxID=2909341 RepID=A0ABS9CVB0_9RHOB|nr:hypothetical protein [Octadecabacter dasysiphoniae]MCF2870121.1 hypothetical protein [Octadecabacter dasysiphoniae]